MARHGGGTERGSGRGQTDGRGGRPARPPQDYGWQGGPADGAGDWREDGRRSGNARTTRSGRSGEPPSGEWGGGQGGQSRPPWEEAGWDEAYDTGSFQAYDTGTHDVYNTGTQGVYDTGAHEVYRPGAGGYEGGSRTAYGTGPHGFPDGHYEDDAYDAPDAGSGAGRMGFAGPGLGYAAETAGRGYGDGRRASAGADTGYQGYPSGGYPEDYGRGDGYSPAGAYPAEARYPDGGEYAAGGEYPGEGDEDYTGYQDAYAGYQDAPRGRAASDRDNDHGYPGAGGWYGHVDDEQDWAEDDDYEGDFLPGLSSATGTRGRDEGGSGGRARAGVRKDKPKRKRGMRRAAPWLALSVLLLLLGTAGGIGYHYYRTIFHPPDYSGQGTGKVVIQIKQGDTATAIGQILAQNGVVASARAFANAAKASPKGNSLEPGFYVLRKHMKAALAFALLLSPKSVDQVKVTIPEGWRLSRIIATLGQQTNKLSQYQAAVKDLSALGLPTWARGPHKPEGYLFPATYTITPDMTAAQVLKQMADRFNQEVTSSKVDLTKWAAHDQMTPAQIIVVASIVQAEGGRASDFPKIARVIYNRLNQGMMLQCDSTVMYALGKYGIRASGQQTSIKSPYNTYAHFGLPPGPIDSPGEEAILAALHPAKGDWTYFVTVNPSKHITKFTSDPNQASIWVQQLDALLAKGGG